MSAGFGLDGARVLVTGAASGMGAAVCDALVDEGADVVGVDLAPVPGRERLTGVEVDVSDPASVDAAFEHAVREHGGLDVVVHAAGIDDVRTKEKVASQRADGVPLDVLSSLPDEQWRLVTDVNLTGTFHVLRAALRTMIPASRGSVVVIGSEAGVHGLPGLPNYSASKAGVHGLVRSVAVEAAPHGVRVNAIAPGVIDTPMSRRSQGLYGGDADAPVAPVGRKGQPVEIASAVLFLASDLASYIVGEVVNVDGGRTAC